MASKNLYSILGVDRNATEDEIKKAYRKMSMKWHPDKHMKDNDEKRKEAENMFKDVSEAYEVLSNKDRRQQYDMFGTTDTNFSSGGGSAEDFMNEFMNMHGFSGFGFGSSSYNGEVHHRGSDKKIRINVTLEDIYFERTKEVAYEIGRSCDNCGGSGSNNGRSSRCPYCGGKGRIRETRRWQGGIMSSETTCPHCGGTGYFIEDPCKDCGGTGVILERVTKEFKVPSIDKINFTYKIEREGHACQNNIGTNGDLYFMYAIKEDPHSQYYIDENNMANICTDIEVDALDCIVGCEREVKTIDGKELKITLPQYTTDGYKFVFNGNGFRCSNGIRGKFIVKVKMVMPKLNDEQIMKIKEIKK